MTPERWEQVERLYHAALERETSQRAAFLREACFGDDALRTEVQSLLAQENGCVDPLRPLAFSHLSFAGYLNHRTCRTKNLAPDTAGRPACSDPNRLATGIPIGGSSRRYLLLPLLYFAAFQQVIQSAYSEPPVAIRFE